MSFWSPSPLLGKDILSKVHASIFMNMEPSLSLPLIEQNINHRVWTDEKSGGVNHKMLFLSLSSSKTCTYFHIQSSIHWNLRLISVKTHHWEFKGERFLEFSKRREGQTFFFPFSTFLSLIHIKLNFFFSLSLELMITQTTQLEICTKDYITTMYPAWGQFLPPENLLANPVILKCKLWEWI